MDLTYDLTLIIETARDLVAELMELSKSLDGNLQSSTDLDTVICILREKQTRVATLKDVTTQIKASLRVDETGKVGIPVPEDVKLKFAELMMDFGELVEEESRIESLIAGNGIPLRGRLGK